MQRCAMVSGERKNIFFDTDTNSYSLQGETVKLSQSVVFGVIDGIKGPPSHVIATISHPVTFEKFHITFYPDGKMRPGAVYLSDDHHHVCYALTVPISHVSSIYTYRYNKDHWERL